MTVCLKEDTTYVGYGVRVSVGDGRAQPQHKPSGSTASSLLEQKEAGVRRQWKTNPSGVARGVPTPASAAKAAGELAGKSWRTVRPILSEARSKADRSGIGPVTDFIRRRRTRRAEQGRVAGAATR